MQATILKIDIILRCDNNYTLKALRPNQHSDWHTKILAVSCIKIMDYGSFGPED